MRYVLEGSIRRAGNRVRVSLQPPWNYWEMIMNHGDPGIGEVRKVRHRISARFHHDPALLVAYYMELQGEYRRRLVVTHEVAIAAELSRPTRRPTGRAKSAARRST